MKIFKIISYLSIALLFDIRTDVHAITMEAIFIEQDGSPITDSEKIHQTNDIYRDLQYEAIYGAGVPNFPEQLNQNFATADLDIKVIYLPSSLYQFLSISLIDKFNPIFSGFFTNKGSHNIHYKYNLKHCFEIDNLSECYKKISEFTKNKENSNLKRIVDNFILQEHPTIADNLDDQEDLISLVVEKILNKKYNYALHHFALRQYPMQNVKDILVKVSLIEREAFINNKVLLMRGITPLRNKAAKGLQDTIINIDPFNDFNDLFEQNTIRSLSFGSRYFSSLLSGECACVLHYFNVQSPDNALYIITLQMPLDEKTKSTYYYPPLTSLADLMGYGEIFHPRSRPSKNHFEPVGFDFSSYSEPLIMKALQSPYNLQELTKAHHSTIANNLVLFQPGFYFTGNLDDEKEKLKKINGKFAENLSDFFEHGKIYLGTTQRIEEEEARAKHEEPFNKLHLLKKENEQKLKESEQKLLELKEALRLTQEEEAQKNSFCVIS